MNLALDKATYDLTKPLQRVDKGRYTVQQTQSRLKTLLGEWLLDPSQGWLNFGDFEKGPDLFDIESRARVVILGTKGVLSIDSMSTTLTKRKVSIQFTASTQYGVINLTVPWDII